MSMFFDDDDCGNGNTGRSVGSKMMLRKVRKVNPSAEGSDDNILSSVVAKWCIPGPMTNSTRAAK